MSPKFKVVDQTDEFIEALFQIGYFSAGLVSKHVNQIAFFQKFQSKSFWRSLAQWFV